MSAVMSIERERRIRALVSALKLDLDNNPELAERFHAVADGELSISDYEPEDPCTTHP